MKVRQCFYFPLISRGIARLRWCGCTTVFQAPVPKSIFRSNSKFDENSKHSSVQCMRPITTIFCTRHDSVTVVTCAKYRCGRLSIFQTREFWIFIKFRIRSKYALWDGRQLRLWTHLKPVRLSVHLSVYLLGAISPIVIILISWNLQKICTL